MTEKQKNRIIYLKYCLNNAEALDDILAGGIPQKWRYYEKRYGMSAEELAQIEIALHGILQGIDIELNHEKRY